METPATIPALRNAAVAARPRPRPRKIPPMTAKAEVTATSNQRCTWGEMGLGARSKMSTVLAGLKFMNLSSANRDALGEGSVGIAASAGSCKPNRRLTRGPGAAENDKGTRTDLLSPGGFMLCEAGSARLFILMGCLTAAHFPVHMRAHSGGRTQSCPFSILWIELSRALGP